MVAGLGFTEDQNCGSGLAREGVRSGDISVGCAGLFAGKPAPTGYCGWSQDSGSLKSKTVGASLLAMAVGLPTSLLNVPASSRASPLPQVLWPTAEFAFIEDQNCGSGLWPAVGLAFTEDQKLWERACSRKRWVRQYLCWMYRLFASRLAPTGAVSEQFAEGYEPRRVAHFQCAAFRHFHQPIGPGCPQQNA